jgi:hypothetical protein
MRQISNSEVGSWLTCQRKYHFEYVMDLEPKVQSTPLTKGILIHAMLEEYYIGKSESLTEEECREMATEPLMRAMTEGLLPVDELGYLRDLVYGYFIRYELDDQRYVVFAVEGKFSMQMTEGFSLPSTIDLIYQDMEDGRYIIIDHKSSYNFWSDEQATMSSQFPKYIAIMRTSGLDVKAGIINQVRTRVLKPGNELYRRTLVKPTDAKIREMIRQHLLAGNQIMEYRKDLSIDKLIGAYDKQTCGQCAFFGLCDSAIEGVRLDYQIAQEFQIRTSYGYNPNSQFGEKENV